MRPLEGQLCFQATQTLDSQGNNWEGLHPHPSAPASGPVPRVSGLGAAGEV